MDGEFENAPRHRKVLIVDDDESLLRELSLRLTRIHYEVVTRSTAIGATAVLLSEEFDYVLLDVLMPGLRPESVVRLIERPNRSSSRLVLLTKLAPEEMRPLLLSTHAVGAVEKTLGSAAFVLAFERCVRKAEKEQFEIREKALEPEEDERVSSILSHRSPPSSRVRHKHSGESLSERLEKFFTAKNR